MLAGSTALVQPTPTRGLVLLFRPQEEGKCRSPCKGPSQPHQSHQAWREHRQVRVSAAAGFQSFVLLLWYALGLTHQWRVRHSAVLGLAGHQPQDCRLCLILCERGSFCSILCALSFALSILPTCLTATGLDRWRHSWPCATSCQHGTCVPSWPPLESSSASRMLPRAAPCTLLASKTVSRWAPTD